MAVKQRDKIKLYLVKSKIKMVKELDYETCNIFLTIVSVSVQAGLGFVLSQTLKVDFLAARPNL